MKVLLISDSPFLNTGFARVARFIGQTLHNAGHEVAHLGFSDPRPKPEMNKWAGRVIPWPVFQTERTRQDEFGQKSYESVLAKTDPRVTIIVADVWNVDHLLVNASCPTVLLLHAEGRPLPSKVTHMIGGSAQEIVIPQVLLHANHVISAGPFGRGVIQERLAQYANAVGKSEQDLQNILKNTATVIPDSVDTQMFHPLERSGLKGKLFNLPDDAFVIGYFGRQNPRKGLPYAVQAFAKWPKRPDNAWLYLHTAIKDVFGWNIVQLLADYGVSDRVIIDKSIKVGGGCSDEILNMFYNACFPVGTPVLTPKGYKEIQRIKKGEEVISGEGNIRKVLATSSRRYSGSLCRITTTRNQIGITSTPNHPFKVLGAKGPMYVAAERLEPGDLLMTPHVFVERPDDDGPVYLDTMVETFNEQMNLVDNKKEACATVYEDESYRLELRRTAIPFYKLNGVTYIISIVEDVAMFLPEEGLQVYNFEVEEDHTYVAAGLGVHNCDITVLPSSGEGAGLTALESSSAGTPVITTNYAEAPNYLTDVCEYVDPAGFWVEPNTNIERAIPDIDHLVQKMKKLHRDPGYRKLLGERARTRMVEKFENNIVALKWLDVIGAADKIKVKAHPIEEVTVAPGKKICFIGSWFLPDLLGGGEITYLQILKGFQAQGWTPYVLTIRPGLKEENVEVDGIRVTRADPSRLEQKIMRYLGNIKPDAVITTLIDPKLTVALLRGAKEVGATTIYYEQFYNSICTKYQDVMRLPKEAVAPWGKEVLGLSDLIYTNSAFVQSAMMKHQGFTSKIMHPYINFNDVRAETRDPRYITLINPDPGKGGDTFLYMVKNMPETEFLAVKVASNGDFRLLEKAQKVYPNLTVWDFQKDPRKIYEQTRVLLVPTVVDETFGRVIQEAQSNGVPVIARDVGGIKDTLGDGGILLPKYEDDDVWIKTLKELLADPTRMQELAEKGRANVTRIDFKSEMEGLIRDVETARLSPAGVSKAPVCCVVPRNFYGVANVFVNMKDVFPEQVHIISVEENSRFEGIMNQIIGQNPKMLLLGAWIPAYMEIIKQVRTKFPETRITVGWFSNFSQMEFSVNNELGIFNELREAMDKGLVHEIWMSAQEDARTLNDKDPRIKWLPCPISLKEAA